MEPERQACATTRLLREREMGKKICTRSWIDAGHHSGDQGWRSWRRLVAHTGCVNASAISRCGNYLATGGDDRSVFLWRVPAVMPGPPEGVSRPFSIRRGHQSNIFSLDWSKDHMLTAAWLHM